MSLGPQPPPSPDPKPPSQIVRVNPEHLEILEALESATPGMERLDQFDSHERNLENLVFEQARHDHQQLFDGSLSRVMRDIKYNLLASRLTTDPGLAFVHNLEVAVIFEARTPDGKYIYSPDEDGGYGTALNSPVFHLYGRTINNVPVACPALCTSAFFELLEIIEERAEASVAWPTRIIAHLRDAIELEFRGGPLTEEQREINQLNLGSICLDHTDPHNLRWIIDTEEGELVLCPGWDQFRDFALAKVVEY